MSFRKEDRAGLYITVIFHLAVIIVLLAAQIGYSLTREDSYLLDFTRQETEEKQQKEEQRIEDLSRKIEEMLAAAQGGSTPVRNVTVDRSNLKDDRGTDAERLYKDAEKLQKNLDQTFSKKDGFAAVEEEEMPEEKPEEEQKHTYKGPSVVSWTLDNRKASKLYIPAYKCIGAGLVTVTITVDNSGRVISAKVLDAVSSTDPCLRDFALRAARMSMFSKSSEAPLHQVGEIVYQFIAQ